MPAHVLLMTRQDCHLCEVAAQTVAEETAAVGAGWSAHDVDADVELRAEFGDRVPVVLLSSAPGTATGTATAPGPGPAAADAPAGEALADLLSRAVEIGYFRIAPEDLRRRLAAAGG